MNAESVVKLITILHPAWYLIPTLFGVFIISRVIPVERFGLVPRRPFGILGVVTMVFLHDDYKHLFANTVPLMVLMALLMATQPGSTIATMAAIQGGGGLLLWIVGRSANHIGASLLVFGLTGFHIANGYLQGSAVTLSIAALVIFLYGGSFLSSVVPWRKGTSWDGHLCGFIAGLGFAFWSAKTTSGQFLIWP